MKNTNEVLMAMFESPNGGLRSVPKRRITAKSEEIPTSLTQMTLMRSYTNQVREMGFYFRKSASIGPFRLNFS